MSKSPDLIFVRHRVTGHAYPINARTLDPDVHELLAGEPARDPGGKPRRTVYDWPETPIPAPIPAPAPRPATPKEK